MASVQERMQTWAQGMGYHVLDSSSGAQVVRTGIPVDVAKAPFWTRSRGRSR